MIRRHQARLSLLLPTLFLASFLAACDFGMRRDIPLEMRSSSDIQAKPAGKLQSGDFTISGPYTHKNLSVFLIHGKETMKGENFLTLEEAMAQKKIVVHETGDVNRLAVENLSDQDIFIQAGEIVKGGRQDRMLAGDMILAPQSGKVPIDAFCVEQGRWSQRGEEESKEFSSSGYYVSDKETKLAARSEKDQSKVWSNVEKAQGKLSTNLSAPVTSEESITSLQLTLENDAVQKTAAEYTRALERIIEGKKDVIGYAFAINGALNSADVYASSGLFGKFWPALLRSNAVEAIAELEGEVSAKALTGDEVLSFLAQAESGEALVRELDQRNRLLTSENDRFILFETRDAKIDSVWVHRSYVVK